MRYNIGRLEIEYFLGECGRQHLTQFPDVRGGRLVAILERHQDYTIIDSDGRAVSKGPIINARRQSDIVNDKLAIRFWNDFAYLVFDCLEYPFRGFDAGSGGSTNVKLDLASVDQREKISADELEHHRTETDDQDGDDGYDEPLAKQQREEFQVSLAQALEAAVERGGDPREATRGSAGVRMTALSFEQQADRDRRQGPRQSVGSQHRKYHGKSERGEEVFGRPIKEHHRREHTTDGQRRHQRRHRDFCGTVQRRIGKRLVLFGPQAVAVLDGDSRIVNQDADRQCKTAKSHGIQSFAEKIQHDQRRQDRQRN